MKMTAERKNRYPSIDALRAMAAIGIIMMHMLSGSNNQYEIGGILAERVIPWFTQLVYLFMMISAFGMCCGYHERMLNGKIDLAAFYKKRAARILPFFSFLVVLDLLTDFSFKRLLEGFANVTLLFGLLPEPGKLTVIGVAWFIGVTFVFYALFPMFCVLTRTRAAAWKTMACAVVYNFACTYHFMSSEQYPDGYYLRQNFLFCAMFFVAGAIIYLYKDAIVERFEAHTAVFLAFAVLITAVYFVTPAIYQNKYIRILYILLIFACWLICAIIKDLTYSSLPGRFIKVLAGYSMEIYLCHMMVFRILQKLKINYLFGHGVLSYCLTVIAVLLGALTVAYIFNFLWSKLCVLLEDRIQGKR